MKKNNEGISIIIPVYNSEKYLDRCLTSVLTQTYQEIELVIVDDGSTDDSWEICKRYAENDSRITLIHQENKGIIWARSVGIRNAKYDIIGFVDSDDWIEKNMYESLMKIMTSYKCDMVSSGIIHDYEERNYCEVKYDHYEEGLYCNLTRDIYPTMLWIDKKQDFGLYCNLVNKLFKKNIFIEIYNELDTRVFYGEDALAFYSYMLKCEKIYVIKKAYYHYLIRCDSMSRRKDERIILNTYYLFKGLEMAFSTNEKCKYSLMRQLRSYILHVESYSLYQIFNINTNVLVDDRWYDKFIGTKIALYGAGDYGILTYQYLQKEIKCEIVVWVDKAPEGKNELCLHDIYSPDVLKQYEYDYILIGIKSRKSANEILDELTNKYQISSDIILWNEPQIASVYNYL